MTVETLVTCLENLFALRGCQRIFFRATEQPSNRATEQPSNRATEQPSNRATEQPSNRATEQPSNRATEQPSNRATEQPSNRATEQPSNRATEQPSSYFSMLVRIADAKGGINSRFLRLWLKLSGPVIHWKNGEFGRWLEPFQLGWMQLNDKTALYSVDMFC
ncbi:PT domain-containing protein [Flexibacterium corallicola]|uniref:PT domain-containing protein n=1 Tax=Flexibacterium corallicola TaxID=3037259 RepID=UPI00286F4179|nr:PT domain-containing protein [Pseudovibrio sp. M1P-2-3]